MASNLYFSFVALFVGLIFTLVYPTNQVHYLAAPLIMLCYNGSLSLSLWVALLSGSLLDALLLSPRLGFVGLSYLMTIRILYPCRLYFFKDSKITLCVLSALFSLVCMMAEFVICLFFEIPAVPFDPSRLLLEPLQDAGFAGLVFVLPSFLYEQYRLRVKRRRCSDDS